MKVKIKAPAKKLKYKPDEKVEYKVTSFRLPKNLLSSLDNWVEEISVEDDRGSVNDLARQIAESASEHKGR
jgi:hypothetical protein